MSNNYATTVGSNTRTKDIIISGILIALVFLVTKFINIKLPIASSGGLVHLGNTVLFMAAIVFGKKKGAISGAFGMALFDILSGWTAWAPFTFVVRGVMGYIIGSVSNARGRNGNKIFWNIVGILIASIWMIAGYYVTEIILYGNYIAPVNSIPGNIAQLVVGAAVAIPLSASLKKTKMF
jgi:uncharacterized membrane protein